MSNKLEKFEIIQEFNIQNKILIEERFITKGSLFPTHFHDYFEIEIFLDGTCEHIYNGKKYTIGAGNAHILSYYDFHSIYAISDLHFIHIKFHEDMLSHELANYVMTSNLEFQYYFSGESFEYIKNIISQLEQEQLQDNIFKDIIVTNLFEQLLIYMLRISNTDSSSAAPQLIQQVVASIHKLFRKRLTLKELANMHSISPNHLGVLFKETLHTSFNDYLNQLRLKNACRMLLATNSPVKEIALSSGYSSVEYFFYSFKKTLNMTPLEFRQVHSENSSNISVRQYSNSSNTVSHNGIESIFTV